ncbi:MAG TPA: hydrogenase maturation nickel metallochaperone HypA, partial [Blastocatellia bacterium]|nr:hydrogenase maturation nickel metallochaperone HypA [Blastocatellia bacterium]
MHEASIVRSMIDIAESEARKHGGSNIRKIKLKVGEFRGVVKEALEFSFAALKKDTLAAEA